LACLVENGTVSPELWTRFTEAVGSPLELAGVIALRTIAVDIDRSKTVKNMYFVSADTIAYICRKLEDQLKILDVGKIGVSGPSERALAIRELIPESQRGFSSKSQDAYWYAAIREERIRIVSDALALALASTGNTFTWEIADVERAIDNALGAVFEKARFEFSRQTVAFTADESYVFSREALTKILKDHALSLATWSALAVADIVEAWPRVPLPLERVPLFFV
jgi:hypothetical protein